MQLIIGMKIVNLKIPKVNLKSWKQKFWDDLIKFKFLILDINICGIVAHTRAAVADWVEHKYSTHKMCFRIPSLAFNLHFRYFLSIRATGLLLNGLSLIHQLIVNQWLDRIMYQYLYKNALEDHILLYARKLIFQ